jgi:hypothetical protein
MHISSNNPHLANNQARAVETNTSQDLDNFVNKAHVIHGSGKLLQGQQHFIHIIQTYWYLNVPKVSWTIVHFRAAAGVSAIARFAPRGEIKCAHSRVMDTSIYRYTVKISINLGDSRAYFLAVHNNLLRD